MSIEHPPHDRQARREAFRNVEHAGNVVPLREDNSVRQPNDAPHQGDELLTALSPLLDEVDGLREMTRRIRKPTTFRCCSKRMPGFESSPSSCQICLATFLSKARRSKFAHGEERTQCASRTMGPDLVLRDARFAGSSG